ncbi:nucleoporin autopeptidase-domain-containing protein [Protomyces lactucae-debilis]|uniref:Nucleoporin autopeptidase-domain-containing protein n=1 Tax=Protomyces lactucae-debilis TaxID=2754530 RepID=A0A1Y2F059_PROLT|nr:nucleoporin autopeptidase-domain-containing protein [Protomyces lactucae-debilis]ORY77281.1 nucleoporin autopeptidase-domain-containing protein [Protomyces lactucae-debilis]
MFNFGQSSTTQQANPFGAPSNNAFGASQPQQQQQPSSIFGQPQQQQPQQQQQSTSFGGFGSTSTPFGAQSASTPFGGFGSTAQSNAPPATTPSFGFGSTQPAPAFGSNSGGLLGSQQANTASSAFGGQQQSGGLFGSSSQPANTGGFGGSSVFGQSMNTNQGNVPNGTANPPFAVTSEKEGTGTGMNHFQSITCMPAYTNASFEELRVQDYAQGRRYGSGPATGGFGSSFGQPSQQSTGLFGQNTSTGFGQSPNAFGQSNQSNIFGAAQPAQSTPFGQPSTTSVFGSQPSNSAPSAGLFGNNSGAGIFGSSNNATTTGFGSTPTQQPSSSIFGQQPSQPASTFGATQPNNSPFGLNTQAQASTGGQKPFTFGGSTSAFGANTTSSTGAFGSNNAANAQPSSIFGQPAQQNTASGGLFGSSATNTNAASAPSFSFGGNNATPSQAPAQFSFGNASNNQASSAPKSLFGSSTAASGSPGAFGMSNPQPAAKPTFSFGGSATPSTSTSAPSLFGNAAQTSSQNMFGNTGSSGGGLFGGGGGGGNNTQQPQQQAGNNVFGKLGGMFGGSQTGSNTTNLFGGTGNAGTSSTLGGGSFFGGQSNAQGQQSQQPSIGNSAYGNNPLFASVQPASATTSPGPLATPLVTNTLKKKSATLPRFNLTPRSNASSPKLLHNMKPALSGSSASTPKKPGLTLFDEDLLMNPDAFSPRSNIKRLVIDRKGDEQELLSGGLDLKGAKEGPPTSGEQQTVRVEQPRLPAATTYREVAVQPAMEAAPRLASEKSYEAAQQAPVAARKPSAAAVTVVPQKKDTDSYWTSPSITALMDMSKGELSKVKDFTVGRRGYGQVSFNQPVDLSSLEQVEDVAGKIVIFEPKMCSVYPVEEMKPAVGKGLNVPATITLEQCYPLSRDKRQPIRDKMHPRFQQHVDRLKRMSETEFVDYLADSGTWIFKVEHF